MQENYDAGALKNVEFTRKCTYKYEGIEDKLNMGAQKYTLYKCVITWIILMRTCLSGNQIVIWMGLSVHMVVLILVSNAVAYIMSN